MRVILTLLTIFTIVGGGFSLFWFSSEQVAIRQTRNFLESASAAVATQDRAVIGKFLNDHIAEGANLELDVTMTVLAITGTEGPKTNQKFASKKEFITFIDNILFSVKNYTSYAELGQLTLSENKDQASITITMKDSASGHTNIMGSTAPARWVANSECKGDITLGDPITIKKLYCNTKLSQQPDINNVDIGDAFKQFQKPQ